MNWIEHLVATFEDHSDFQHRRFEIGDNLYFVLYLDSLVDHAYIQNHIVEKLNTEKQSSFFQEISAAEEAVQAIVEGKIVIWDASKQLLMEALSDSPETRSIQETENESLLRGPRDAFVEALNINLSLIRRRLPNPDLKVNIYTLGRQTKTKVAMLFVEGIVNPNVLDEIRTRLSTMDIDQILDSGVVEQWIEDSWYSPFPQVQYTELPAKVLHALLEGRVALLVDGSPQALIVPVTFSMLFQAPDDYYERWVISTAIRFIRLTAAVVALTLPSLYIALISYHPGLIPTQLAMSITASRSEVPFPALIEAIAMEATLEMLREAGLRLPKMLSQTVGIVGGLVIGQAAVEAGIVSPVLVIVVAITAISSFLVPAYNMSIALRLLRFPLMLLAGSLGLFGLILGMMMILIHLVSLKSFGINYLSPIVPYRPSDWKDLLIRAPLPYLKERPEILHPLNKKRMNLQKRKKGW